MNARDRTEIERFLRRSFCDDAARLFVRIEVRHHPKDQNASLVWRKEWGEDDVTGAFDGIHSLCDQVSQVVVDDSSKLRGRQRYQLVAIDHDGGKMGRHLIVIDGGDEYDEHESAEFGDDPSLKGIVRQQMRMNEALAKSGHMALGQVITTQQRMLDRTMHHLERMMEQRLESFSSIEEALSLRHERELEMIREGSKQELIGRGLEKVELLLPAVINKIAGQPLLPAHSSPREQMVDALVGSITPEQANALMQSGLLTQEQLIVMLELIKPSDPDGNNGA